MRLMDVNILFQRAEQAYLAGEPSAARADVEQVLKLTGDHPAVFHLLALIDKQLGKPEAARLAFERALDLAPYNVEIAVNAGNFYLGIDDHVEALRAFTLALAGQPDHAGALRGRGACYAELGQFERARADYQRAADIAPRDPKPWNALGALARRQGDLEAAANAFDRALGIAPAAPIALHGRARVALERGEHDAPQRFTEVERLLPDDQQVALGAAEALVPRNRDEAITRLRSVIARYPDWADAHSALARLLWERGERDGFANELEKAVLRQPHNPPMWRALVGAYNGVDRHLDAADAAARAGQAMGGDAAFSLMEASHASEGGDIERANALFRAIPSLPGGVAAEARHRLKTGEVEHAAALLETGRADAPNDIALWAWTGIVWRLTHDARSEWLYQPDRLVAAEQLAATSQDLEIITSYVENLHCEGSFPIGQSLRGGTQTRGRLLERADDVARRLRATVATTVETYWQALPAEDLSHPLLRHRLRKPRVAGSWSVRLVDGGFHVAHIHPRGLLSSAYYLLVPQTDAPAGWLELGRPPADLGLDLAPLRLVEPLPGRIVLFPSYLHHGTIPFDKGERLSVAFDVEG